MTQGGISARLAAVVCLCLCSAACETFKTRFSQTYTSTDNSRKIYRLDLSGDNLITLPDNLYSQTNLRVLILDNNPQLDFASLRRACAALPHLNTLSLQNNRLTKLPGALSACRHLTHLSLAENPQIELAGSHTLLQQLPLVFLNLSGNNLGELPGDITSLQQLRDLRLSRNRLGAGVFKTLGRLPQLYSLWLDHNQMAELPPEAGHLAQIRYLFLDHNQLSRLPTEIQQMQRLRVIHLNHNQFTEIPAELTTAPSLTVAFMASNRITSFNKRFLQARHRLQGIVLDNNRLSQTQQKQAAELFSGYFLFSADNQQTVPKG